MSRSRPSVPRASSGRARLLTDEAIGLMGRRFSALADPTRLRLVTQLFEAEKSAGDLAGGSGSFQPNISRHLQVLAEAGILARRKRGLQVYYSIADPALGRLCDLMCDSLERQLAQQAKAFTQNGN